MYHRFGVKAGMLTWNNKNEFAYGVNEKHGGLTDLGKLAIKKMNELGSYS